MSTPTDDLNVVIASAVNARIETAVLEALSGDQFFGQLVAKALHAPVEVKDSMGYRSHKTTFLAHTLESAMKGAVKAATARLILEQADEIEELVRKELRKSSADIAKTLVASMTGAAEKPYGIGVTLNYPSRG